MALQNRLNGLVRAQMLCLQSVRQLHAWNVFLFADDQHMWPEDKFSRGVSWENMHQSVKVELQKKETQKDRVVTD